MAKGGERFRAAVQKDNLHRGRVEGAELAAQAANG
jgi:hypothetical protein